MWGALLPPQPSLPVGFLRALFLFPCSSLCRSSLWVPSLDSRHCRHSNWLQDSKDWMSQNFLTLDELKTEEVSLAHLNPPAAWHDLILHLDSVEQVFHYSHWLTVFSQSQFVHKRICSKTKIPGCRTDSVKTPIMHQTSLTTCVPQCKALERPQQPSGPTTRCFYQVRHWVEKSTASLFNFYIQADLWKLMTNTKS